ncbi:MAG: VIT domain-containing protein [Nitrospiraceae bacterium]
MRTAFFRFETAAVDHLLMHVGDRIIEGHVKERGEAKQTYERGKQQGQRAPVWSSKNGPTSSRLLRLLHRPGETIIVEIQYQEIVR